RELDDERADLQPLVGINGRPELVPAAGQQPGQEPRRQSGEAAEHHFHAALRFTMDVEDESCVVLTFGPFAAGPTAVGLLVINARLVARLVAGQPRAAKARGELRIVVAVAEKDRAASL